MVLEKASVLLNGDDNAALSRYLEDYESGDISVDAFAESLLLLISDQEKTSFFTEIREVVREEDVVRFDQIIFGRGKLFDELLRGYDNHIQQLRHVNRGQEWNSSTAPKGLPTSRNSDRDLLSGTEDPLGMTSFPSRGFSSTVDDGMGEFYPGDSGRNGGLDYTSNGYKRHQPSSEQSLRDVTLHKQRQPCNMAQIEAHPTIAGFPSHDRKLRSHMPRGLQTVHIAKCCSTLGIAIEGGTDTQQPLPRIISIQPNGAAFQTGGLRIGQLISAVDGYNLTGLPHENVARIIAECFAKRDRQVLTLVVKDQKLTPAEMRRSFMLPQ